MNSNNAQGFWVKYPLYVKILFASIVAFAMVGNCSGHREASLVIFAVVTVCWVCTRIIAEAIDSFMILKQLNRLEKEDHYEKAEDKDPPA